MKNQMKLFLTLAVMLIGTMTAWADGLVEITKQKAGVETEDGMVTAEIGYGQCTLTVTCPEGYGLRASDITAVRVLDTEFMQSRRADAPKLTTTPPVDNDKITVTGANGTFVFDMPESPYDVNVTVNFQPLIPITWVYGDNTQYVVTYHLMGDTPALDPLPTMAGSTLTGWTPEITAVTGPRSYVAVWEFNEAKNYTVKHYQQALDGTYPAEPTETELSSGPEGAQTEAVAKAYEGFTAGTVTQQTIAGDGTTVVSIQYSRNQYTITFDSGEGGSAVANIVAYYGAPITAPEAPTKNGYTFTGWYDGTLPYVFTTMPEGGKALKAKWHYVPQNDVLYTVEHYLANIDGAYPDTPTEAYQLSGTEGTDTQAEAKSYEGFTAQAFSQAAINANGQTVVKIYYARNQYTITFDSDGGSEIAAIQAVYGAAVTAPADPTKEGYVFSGWDAEIPETMPIGGAELTATWLKLGDVNNDGNVTALDAALILQYVARIVTSSTDGFYVRAADVNVSGDVTALDASLVLQYVARLITW